MLIVETQIAARSARTRLKKQNKEIAAMQLDKLFSQKSA